MHISNSFKVVELDGQEPLLVSQDITVPWATHTTLNVFLVQLLELPARLSRLPPVPPNLPPALPSLVALCRLRVPLPHLGLPPPLQHPVEPLLRLLEILSLVCNFMPTHSMHPRFSPLLFHLLLGQWPPRLRLSQKVFKYVYYYFSFYVQMITFVI